MELSQLGSKIKAERRRQKITLEALAEQIGISRNFLWEIEAGRKAPALKTLYNLSIALNISIDYLMGVSEERRRIGRAESAQEVQLTEMMNQLRQCSGKELQLVSRVLNELIRYLQTR